MSSTFRSSQSHDHILMKKLKVIGTIIIIKDILQEFKIFNGDLKGLAKSFCVPTEGLEGKDEKLPNSIWHDWLLIKLADSI